MQAMPMQSDMLHRLIATGASLGGPYMPHAMCILASPWLIYGMIIANLTIAISYFVISGSVAKIMRSVPKFSNVAELRGLVTFVAWCGVTHLASIVVLFTPLYIGELGIMTMTAFVSANTAVVIVKGRAALITVLGQME